MPTKPPCRDEAADEKHTYRLVAASPPLAPFLERGSSGPPVRWPQDAAPDQPLRSVSPRAGLRSELARVLISALAAIPHLVVPRVRLPRWPPAQHSLQSRVESPARLLDPLKWTFSIRPQRRQRNKPVNKLRPPRPDFRPMRGFMYAFS